MSNIKILDEKGVSPVVGTILLVAVTVLVAGSIAAFVMNMGTPTSTPTTNLVISDATESLSGTGADSILDVEHKGGDSIPFNDLKVVVHDSTNGNRKTLEPNGNVLSPDANDYIKLTFHDTNGNGEFDVGEYGNLEEANDSSWAQSGDKITINFIHTPSKNTIAERTVTVY